MIMIHGPMTLCNEVSPAITSAGQMQLTLSATSPHPTQPNGTAYRLVWTGPAAACFWTDYGHALKLGANLRVIATDPRPLIDRGEACVMATITDIQVIKQGTHPVTKAKPTTRWAALTEVAA